MSIVDNQVISSLPGLTASSSGPTNDRLGQDQFLELMITQLKNQDPLKPMENGEFLGQIAQFSTVSGIQDLQTAFSDLSTSLVSNQALQASSLVGKTVLAPASASQHQPGEVVKGAVELPSSTNQLIVNVVDASGQVIRRLDLGLQGSGLSEFSWDGKDNDGAIVPAGVYSYKPEANIGGDNFALEPLLMSEVTGVTLSGLGQGLRVDLDGIGTVDFANVRKIMN